MIRRILSCIEYAILRVRWTYDDIQHHWINGDCLIEEVNHAYRLHRAGCGWTDHKTLCAAMKAAGGDDEFRP